jgi:hypothetical protein
MGKSNSGDGKGGNGKSKESSEAAAHEMHKMKSSHALYGAFSPGNPLMATKGKGRR